MFSKSLSILLACTAWASAPVSFNSPEVLAPPAIGIVAADFNHDGKLDLAVLDSTRLIIRLGNGQGGFRLKAEYAMPMAVGGPGEIQLAAADFNGDGHLDLVALNVSATGFNIAILMNQGDGTFDEPIFYSVAGGPLTVAIADFNGDGKPDLAVSTYQQTVTILLNTGTGAFTPSGSVRTGSSTSFVAADFNGDGLADLATTAGIQLGNGDGTFLPPLPYPIAAAVYPRFAVDLNADGKPDLLAIVPGGMAVFLGKGDGTLLPHSLLGNSSDLNFVAGDFNGDGRTDVAGVSPIGVDLFLNDGHGGLFPPALSYPAGQWIYALAVGDFNGDKKLDLVAAGSGTTILQGDGRGGLQQAASYPVLGATTSLSGIAAGDLNGDGLPDLVETAGARLSVALNDAHGGYVQGPVYALPNTASAVVLADFNGDGRLDVAVAMLVENKIAVQLGNGDGSFAAPVYYDSVRAPVSLAVADFNGDGKLDLAVGGTGLGILLGNGDGTFQPPAHYAIGGTLASLAVADLNNDGHPDLVIANEASIVVLLGKGDGSFSPPAFITTGDRTLSLAAADLNGDGKPDLAVVGLALDDSTELSVLLGRGDGFFQTPVHYTGFTGATQVAIADFNADGAPDLAVLCLTSFSVSIVLGDGTGRFQTALESTGFLSSGLPSSLTVADLNRDGKPDIAINTSGSNGLVILTNTTR